MFAKKQVYQEEKGRVNLQKWCVSELSNYLPDLSRKDDVITQDMCNYKAGTSLTAVGYAQGTHKKDS